MQEPKVKISKNVKSVCSGIIEPNNIQCIKTFKVVHGRDKV